AAERANFVTSANLKLGDNWEAYGDLFFSNEDTNSAFTPASLSSGSYVLTPATGGAAAVSNILPATNPSARGGIATPINYAFLDNGRRDTITISNAWRVTAGIKGTFLGWDVDGGYGHSEDHVSFEGRNYVNAESLTADIANGSYNFLNPLSTPAGAAGLNITDAYRAVSKLDTVDVKGSGRLFDLPGGPMKMAIGAEFRHESEDQPGDPDAALLLSTGFVRVVADRSVWAVFGEFDFPILKSLDADIAIREEHYGDVGSTGVKPQYTLKYTPFQQLTLRASYAQGFRAPSLEEASNSTLLSNSTVNDALDPQGRPTENVGNITSGNPNIKPETSKNLNLGVTVNPVDNVTLSADFYNLWLYNVIAGSATPQQVIDDPGAFPPGSLVRAADGTAIYTITSYSNQFEINTSGIDLAGNYTFPLAVGGRVNVGLGATYVNKFQINQAGVWRNFTGQNGWDYDSPIAGGGPVPHWKGSLNAGWANDTGLSAGATMRYTAGYQNSLTVFDQVTTQVNVASFTAFDLNAEYKVKNWDFRLSVLNVLNRYPPYDSAAMLDSPEGDPYDPFTYDDLGRAIDLHVKFSL
ncbi:MAG TPA: TonB-dependent receptor, partial [Steroidobacteraceae bacterium]|nr:TonB-dependent receptor [Steroidobacteraceae bacterium]